MDPTPPNPNARQGGPARTPSRAAARPDLGIVGTSAMSNGQNAVRESLTTWGRRAAALEYQDMRDTDPVVGGVFLALESMFRRVEWREVPADDSTQAQEWADFLRQCREDMSHTWAGMIAQALTQLVHGYAVFELVWKLRGGPDQTDPRYRSAYTDNRVGWRKFAFRPQPTLTRWEFDGDGGVQGVYQSTGLVGVGTVFLPIQRLVHFRTTEAGDDPTGRSMLVNARRAFRFQSHLEQFEAVGVERDLAGLPVVEVPIEAMGPDATPEQKAAVAAMEAVAGRIRRDEQGYVVMPSSEYVVADTDLDGNTSTKRMPTGYKFYLLTSGGQRAHDTDKIIRRYSQRIAASLLATFLLLGGSEGKGAQALSSDLTDLFELAGLGILDGMAETLNRYAVAPLMKLNGVPPELWPKLEHAGLSDSALQAFLNRVSTLLTAGGLTRDDGLENDLRARLGLPEYVPPDPATDPNAQAQGTQTANGS